MSPTSKTKKSKSVDEYLALPYRLVLTPDQDDQGRRGWVAEVAELPGAISQGDTPDEALEHLRDAMAGWLSVALEDGIEVPVPGESASARYSGRFLLRLPASLHGALVRTAEAEGVSLNQYALGVLAASVGWRQAGPPSTTATARRTHERWQGPGGPGWPRTEPGSGAPRGR